MLKTAHEYYKEYFDLEYPDDTLRGPLRLFNELYRIACSDSNNKTEEEILDAVRASNDVWNEVRKIVLTCLPGMVYLNKDYVWKTFAERHFEQLSIDFGEEE